MFETRRLTPAAAALLACGFAPMLALTACSSGSSSSSAASSTPASSSAASSPGGTASASPFASGPSWAIALGPGVTVQAPAPATPGNDSPAEAMAGYAKAISGTRFQAVCPYLPPSGRSNCLSEAKAIDLDKPYHSKVPYTKNFGVGYVAVDGAKAVVGTTGTYCQPGASPLCLTNDDPAAIFTSGKSFASLYKMAIAGTNSPPGKNPYTLYPCVELGGKWYVDVSVG